LDPYGHWARVYDLFYPDRSSEVCFWASRIGGAGRQVLDLMCGTAEVSLALARLGHHVVGLDRSGAMLAVGAARLEAAADYPARTLSLVQADACASPLAGQRFDFVLVGGNGSFNHLDRDQAAAALEEMFRVLAPGGGLGMELLNPFLLPQIDPERVFGALRPTPAGVWVEMQAIHRYDARVGQLHIQQRTRYELGDDHGEMETSFVLSAWTPSQIGALLEGAGLGNIQCYGGYALEPFDRWSSDLLVMARRPARPGEDVAPVNRDHSKGRPC
jgi:ubiquinone/menaquinone biosynthesis C-methylase UbiE